MKLGIRTASFQQYADRSLASAISQYYGIVQDDLMLARHLFRGLKRPLLHGGDQHADQDVLVYSWRSTVDYKWVGTPQRGHPERMNPPPKDQVFVVLVREEKSNEHDILGSIERWNWVREDPDLPHAPVEWQERYGETLEQGDMKRSDQLEIFVKEAFSEGQGVEFRPCAFFDDRLDCIRIITRDCSVLEERIDGRLTILLDNYAEPGPKQYIGFTVKGARHFCQQYGFALDTPIRMGKLLDALLASSPDILVRCFIELVVKPLVEDKKVEQVEIPNPELAPA